MKFGPFNITYPSTSDYWHNKAFETPVCPYCLKKLDGEWSSDHIKPKSRGGKSEFDNLVRCCHVCNNARGPMSLLRYVVSKNIGAKLTGDIGSIMRAGSRQRKFAHEKRQAEAAFKWGKLVNRRKNRKNKVG